MDAWLLGHSPGPSSHASTDLLPWSVPVDLCIANLPKLRQVGDRFVCNCTSLREATFGLPALTAVGDSWMRSCEALESLHLVHLPKLQVVGNRFLSSCTSLKQVTLEDLPELTRVGFWK